MSGRKCPSYQDVDGLRVCSELPPEIVRSALAYKPEDDDLFIVTYPKCGTTWIQQIVYLIFHKGVPPSDFNTFMTSTPFLELSGAEAVKDMPRPGAIKTHLPFHLQPYSPEAKYIYVARNPKDCCVSFYHHTKNIPPYGFTDGSFDDYFEVFINGQTDFGDYFDHLLSWYEHRNDPNVLFLTYEDMKKDTRSEVLRIARFIGEEYGKLLEANEDILQNILKHSSIDHMKKGINEAMKVDFRNAPPESVPKAFRGILKAMTPTVSMGMKGDFIRKGIIGDWRTHFSEEQNQRMDDRIAEKTNGSDVMKLWTGVNI